MNTEHSTYNARLTSSTVTMDGDFRDNPMKRAVQAWLSKNNNDEDMKKETKVQFAQRYNVDYDEFRKRIQAYHTRKSRENKIKEAKIDLTRSSKYNQRDLKEKPTGSISNQQLFAYMSLSDYLKQFDVKLESITSTEPPPTTQRTHPMELRTHNRDDSKKYNYEICNCEKSAHEKDCSSDCPNASTGVICHAQNCGLMYNHNIQCSNNWIMDVYPMSKCIPQHEPKKALGMGLLTTRDITPGTVIGPYTGEKKNINDEGDKTYRADLNDRICVDALKKGNILRYINHSCTPNCELFKQQICGVETLFVRSLQTITKGAFLYFKYNKEIQGKCMCDKCLDKR